MINESINKNFIKNSSKLFIGSAIAQIIGFISIFIKTRLYSPDDFGFFALIISIVAIISSFITLGLTSAIVTEDSDANSKLIVKFISIILFVGLLIIVLIQLIFYPKLKLLKVSNHYWIYFFSMIIITIGNVLLTIHSTFSNRIGNYKILSIFPIIQNIFTLLFSVLLSFSSFKSLGLIIGYLLGLFIALLCIFSSNKSKKISMDKTTLKSVLKKNKEFILYQYPSSIFNTFTSNIPTILIASLFGEIVLGNFSMSQKLLTIPITLIASSMGKVFFKEASALRNDSKDLGFFMFKYIKTVTLLALVPILFLFVTADLIVPLILGDEWITAGKYIQIMSIYYLFVYLMNSTIGLPALLRLQKFNFFIGLISLILNIASIYLSYYITNDPISMIFLYTLINSIIQVFMYYVFFKSTTFGSTKYISFTLSTIIIILILGYLIRLIIF